MQIRSFRESVTKARGPPAPKLLSKTAGCTAGKIVGAPRLAGPQGHRTVSGEFALSRGVSHPTSCRANLDSLARRSSFSPRSRGTCAPTWRQRALFTGSAHKTMSQPGEGELLTALEEERQARQAAERALRIAELYIHVASHQLPP